MDKKFLTISEACSYLNISKTAFWNLRKKADFPKAKQVLSTKPLFDINELDQWVKSKTVSNAIPVFSEGDLTNE